MGENDVTFQSDPKALRTFDSDRGLELFASGGGSDGRRGFRLKGEGFELKFDAYLENHPYETDANFVIPYRPGVKYWKVRAIPKDMEGIVREALKSFTDIRGYFDRSLFEVSFPGEQLL